MNVGSFLKESLRELLQSYDLRYPGEQVVTRRFLDFLDSGESLQGRVNLRRHITASAWVVNVPRTKVLLTHHAKLGIWVQLGGHTEDGEGWSIAALREAHEESGISSLRLVDPGLFDLDIHEIPGRPGVPAHDHYDLRFLVEADEATSVVVSDESLDLAWVPLTELGRYTDEESQHRMARKTL